MGSNVRKLAASAVKERVSAGQFRNLPYKAKKTEWKALLRMLDKTDASYKN
jgi:hypothetical protein